MAENKGRAIWDLKIVERAIWDSILKLNPRKMMSNPVMFVVEVGSVVTTVLLVRDVMSHQGQFGFNLQITLWLWFTVLFANFAEAMAEGRGKAQADALRKARSETVANRVLPDGQIEKIASSKLRSGDLVSRVGGRIHSGRRRNRGRRGLGGRIRDHGRVRARHSRSRRRPLGRHRRHARTLRRHQGQDHFQSRRNLPRSNDRAGRRGGAAEDAQ